MADGSGGNSGFDINAGAAGGGGGFSGTNGSSAVISTPGFAGGGGGGGASGATLGGTGGAGGPENSVAGGTAGAAGTGVGGDGGAGGNGGSDGFLGDSGGGGGGGGGTAGNGASGTITGTSTGGAGGAGGDGGTNGATSGDLGSAGGGGGGSGGYGAIVTVNSLTNGFAVTGGAGGAGGAGGTDPTGVGGNGGNGGTGGVGVQLTGAATTFTNDGTITGGQGGAAGNQSAGGNPSSGGIGGTGGMGLAALGATIINRGTISGGAAGGINVSGNAAGTAGDGIVGSSLTIINSGTISSGGAGANAITFTGGSNFLNLNNGIAGSLVGNIAVTGSVTFDQSAAVVLGNVITGSGAVIVDGPGTLILGGLNTYGGGTTITLGTVLVTNSAALSTGTVAMSDGTTLFGDVNAPMTNAVTLTGTDTISSFGQALSWSGTISGAGTLIVGAVAQSFLTLSGANDYSGGTTVEAGTLELAASGSLADTAITLVGATLKDDTTGSYTVNGIGSSSSTVDYTNLNTLGLVAIVQGGNGTVNKGGGNGVDTLTSIRNLVDTGTGRSNSDVFEVDSAESVTANSSNFNYLIELSAGVNLAYGTNFTGITEFVSNVGANTVSFSADPNIAYLYGSTGNDTLTLGSGGGYMFGEGGTNILKGGANATNFFVGGGGGSDTMKGGTGSAANYYYVDGNDQVDGAGAFNAVIELAAGATVQLGSSQYQDVQEFVAGGGNDVVSVANTDSNFVYLYGGAGNDTLSTGSGGGYLFGEGGTNLLNGGGGTNVFVADGASGVDTMNGGTGSNIFFIDGNSTVHGAGTFNTVEELQQNVSLTLGSAQLGSDIQEVVLKGGTNTVDFHTATSAVYLYGSAGDDTLMGGAGNDFLYGGAGTNTFGFQAGWGHDTIMDWTTGTNNQIDLTALASSGVHAISDLTQTITNGSDVITSSHTGSNSITLHGVNSTLAAGSFKFA